MWKNTGLILLALFGCRTPETQFQLVETAPVESSIGSDDLPEFHEVWRELIGAAAESIELAHFYASNADDSRLEPVIVALESAAARGVRVRFLADEHFYGTYPATLDRLAAVVGIEVRRLDLREQTGGVLHAKYLVVDGRVACLGSANFDWRSLEHIQELGAVVDSAPVAGALREVFEYDWSLAQNGSEGPRRGPATSATAFPVRLKLAGGGELNVTPVFSPKSLLPSDDLWDLPRLIAWIDGARRDLRIQLLTFRMQDRDGERFVALESAIHRAALRGVEVRLLVADWGKRPGTIEGLKELAAMQGIEVRMVTVPPARAGHIPYGRVIHSKYMVVDQERAWIGTSNWERSYFHESRNVGLLIEGEACAHRLIRYFDDGWQGPYSYVVDPAVEYAVPRIGE